MKGRHLNSDIGCLRDRDRERERTGEVVDRAYEREYLQGDKKLYLQPDKKKPKI